jgi:hypothetical protein
MERIKIEGTENLPSILFDGTNGILKITGRSIPENPNDLYDQIRDGIDDYMKDPLELLEVTISLEFFNTSTARELLSLFRKLESTKCKCIVKWIYEEGDDDMLEAGEDYQNMVNGVKFEIIEMPEEN